MAKKSPDSPVVKAAKAPAAAVKTATKAPAKTPAARAAQPAVKQPKPAVAAGPNGTLDPATAALELLPPTGPVNGHANGHANGNSGGSASTPHHIEAPFIEVYGAREHNLKNVSVKIPRNKLVVFTGISGSGKSSLAFDTIYAEGTAALHGNVLRLCPQLYGRAGAARRGQN